MTGPFQREFAWLAEAWLEPLASPCYLYRAGSKVLVTEEWRRKVEKVGVGPASTRDPFPTEPSGVCRGL